MSNPRIEEVSDSDPEIDDIDNFLPSDSQSIISPANLPQPSSASSSSQNGTNSGRGPPPGIPPNMLRPQGPNRGAPQSLAQAKAQKEAIKHFQALYPVYFDASRTRAEGRRVSKKLASKNPLAREIVEAVSTIFSGSARIAFEPDKIHPKDWSNPGRVRVQLRDKETGKWLGGPKVKNKSHLYILVAEWLQAHPATTQTPMKLQISGMPPPEKYEPPAVPKGWKINEILPLHSPAISGGGVSENVFKDMMAHMQAEGGGQLPPGMAGALGGPPASSGGGGGEPKKKRDKRKGKA